MYGQVITRSGKSVGVWEQGYGTYTVVIGTQIDVFRTREEMESNLGRKGLVADRPYQPIAYIS